MRFWNHLEPGVFWGRGGAFRLDGAGTRENAGTAIGARGSRRSHEAWNKAAGAVPWPLPPSFSASNGPRHGKGSWRHHGAQGGVRGADHAGGEAATLASCSALLGWDEQTYMPPGCRAPRPADGRARGPAPREGDPPPDRRVARRARGSALVADPESPPRRTSASCDAASTAGAPARALVEELARVTSIGQQEWAEARRQGLRRAAADPGEDLRPQARRGRMPFRKFSDTRIGSGLAYDPLLDEYEPGARSADLARLFGALRRTTSLVAEILEPAAGRVSPVLTTATYPAIASGSSARPSPRPSASTSGAGGWT